MSTEENPIYTYVERDVIRKEELAFREINVRDKYFHKTRLLLSKYKLVIKIGNRYYSVTDPVNIIIKAQKVVISTCPERLYEVFNFCRYISHVSTRLKTPFIIATANSWNRMKELAKKYDEIEKSKETTPNME